MQTQFAIVMVHTVTNIVVDCSFPKGFNWAVSIYALSLIALFANFYRKAYTGKPLKSASKGHEVNGVHKDGRVNGYIKRKHIERS